MINTIFLILDIVMWAIFALSILFGFLRGQKKSIIHLAVTIVVVLVAILLTNPVASIFSKIKINGKSLISLLSENIDQINLEDGSVAVEYVNALITAVMRLPVYYILLFINLNIVRPILKAIVKGIFKNRSRGSVEKEGKIKISIASRGIGAAIAVPAFIIVFFVITSPIFGIVGLAENISENKDQLSFAENTTTVEENVESDVFATLDEILDSMNSKPFFAICKAVSGKNHNLNVTTLSNLLKFKTENGTIKIKKEMDALIPIASIAIKATETENPIDVVILNRELIISSLKNSDLINVFMPLAVEIADNNTSEESIDFTKLKNVNWMDEKNRLIDILDAAIKFLDSTDFDLNDPIKVLGSEKLSIALKELGKALQQSEVVHDILMVYANDYLNETLKSSLPEGLEAIADIINLVKLDLENDFEILGIMANQIYETGLVTDSTQFNIIENRTQIKNIIINAFHLSTIKGNEEKLISQLVTYTKFDEKLADMGVVLNYHNVDWDREVGYISDILYDVLEFASQKGFTNFDDVDMLTLVKDNINDPLVIKIIDNICDSQVMHGSIVSLIHKVLENANLQNWESQRFKDLANGTAKEEPNEVKNEIHNLLNIVNDALDLLSDGFDNIDFKTFTDEQFASIESILHTMNSSNFLAIDELSGVVNNMLSSTGYDVSTIGVQDQNKNGTTKDEWDEEIALIISIVKDLRDLPDLSEESIGENAATLGKVLDTMKESKLLGNDLRKDGTVTTDDNVFNSLIFEVLKTTGLIKNAENENGFIDEATAKSTDWSKYDYETELAIISKYNSDLAPEEQGNEIFGELQSSQIIQDFFDMNQIVKDIIGDDQIFNVDGTDYNILDYVNITNERLEGLDWEEEMDAVDILCDAFEASSTEDFKAALNDIITNSDTKDSLAAEAAQKILDELNK